MIELKNKINKRKVPVCVDLVIKLDWNNE